MVELPPEFTQALDDPPESELCAILPPGSEAPGVSEAIALLSHCKASVSHVAPVAPEHPGARWELELELSVPGRAEPALARAWLEPAPLELLAEGVSWRGISQRELSDARQGTWALSVSMSFSERPLADYHAQARVLAALAPDAAVAIDVNAARPRSGTWLREVADASVPPAPIALFSIHDVGEPGAAGHWLHTHGLDRCGALELDALDVPGDRAGLVGELMNAVAALLLEQGLPEPGRPFSIGQDIALVWLPWPEGIAKVSDSAPGGRRDRDAAHRGARAVLFAPARGLFRDKYQSLAVHLPLLEGNPLLYVSAAQTERMALLASERLKRFLTLFDRWGSQAGWLFLVKLGYAVDGAESDADREHLWFRVHGYGPGEVDATLLNQPYRVERLHEGDRGRHALELLTDWAILCEQGRFDADNVAELERALSARAQLH